MSRPVSTGRCGRSSWAAPGSIFLRPDRRAGPDPPADAPRRCPAPRPRRANSPPTCWRSWRATIRRPSRASTRRTPARLRRAWEVLRATGRPLSDWQDHTAPPALPVADCLPPLLLDARSRLAGRAHRHALRPACSTRARLEEARGQTCRGLGGQTCAGRRAQGHRRAGADRASARRRWTLDAARRAAITASRQ